jgi:hypothetical protein
VSYEAKIIADSISPAGVRLTTLQVTFPRFILAELSRHRMFSLSVESSRAIPVKKRIERVESAPFIPEQFGQNRKGMQASSLLDDGNTRLAREAWVASLNYGLIYAAELERIGVHKQLANRLLDPFSWCIAVVTATDWDNFFHLRCHPDAQPEFQKIAGMMRDTMEASTPAELIQGAWHLPYTTPHARFIAGHRHAALVSAARCARVSYLTHDGKQDTEADLALATKLLAAGHMSPFEHPATPMDTATEYYGNFKGWCSYRKLIPGESDILGYRNDSIQQ